MPAVVHPKCYSGENHSAEKHPNPIRTVLEIASTRGHRIPSRMEKRNLRMTVRGTGQIWEVIHAPPGRISSDGKSLDVGSS